MKKLLIILNLMFLVACGEDGKLTEEETLASINEYGQVNSYLSSCGDVELTKTKDGWQSEGMYFVVYFPSGGVAPVIAYNMVDHPNSMWPVQDGPAILGSGDEQEFSLDNGCTYIKEM